MGATVAANFYTGKTQAAFWFGIYGKWQKAKTKALKDTTQKNKRQMTNTKHNKKSTNDKILALAKSPTLPHPIVSFT